MKTRYTFFSTFILAICFAALCSLPGCASVQSNTSLQGKDAHAHNMQAVACNILAQKAILDAYVPGLSQQAVAAETTIDPTLIPETILISGMLQSVNAVLQNNPKISCVTAASPDQMAGSVSASKPNIASPVSNLPDSSGK